MTVRSELLLIPFLLVPPAIAQSPGDEEMPSIVAERLEVRSSRLPEARDHEAPAELAALERSVAVNVARLRSEGRYIGDGPMRGGFPPLFDWPLADVSSGAFDPWRVTNFVDQDPDYPGEIRDYLCGTRTYDTNDGYNHTGIDISLWPFPWRQKARGAVAVVAAAPGQIVDRRDGHPDQSCTLSGGTSNTIVLAHADGSQSYYRHLKSGSVTPKQIGDDVARGEILGRVASSGNSTGPHLHFAARNDLEELIEPYAGLCNAQANGMTSWWADQPSYRPYALVDLTTHSATPDIPPCPQVEQTNFKRLFGAGDRVIIGAFLIDPTVGDSTDFDVYRPNGSLHTDFSVVHDEVANRLEAYWQFTLPEILLPSWRGRWRIRAVSTDAQGGTVTRWRSFWVGALFADDFERVNLFEAGWTLQIVLP